MIEIQNLTVTYKARGRKFTVLDNVHLTIASGDICVIIGPSGCGKSTLLKVLAGIVKEFDGAIQMNGRPIIPGQQRIGFIPQNYGLLEWKNVHENAILGWKIKDGKSNIQKKYADDLLKRLGLKGLEARYPCQLSGGQRQRVAIARSFLLKPDLLLMDEPFSALDAITREEIQNVFFALWKEYKVSTILVTHSVEEAIYLGKKIIIMSDLPGRVIKCMKNPLFGREKLREQKAYFQLCQELRKMFKEDGSH